jgi:superfamily II DNA or RNA helicase
MSFDLEDFFPTYPNIDRSELEFMNAYDDNFYQALYNKEEFASLKLSKVEEKPENEVLYNHQKIIARYASGHTPYDGILLVHQMGSGKSMAMFGAIEQIRGENVGYKGALILTRNPRILINLKKELATRYSQYSPDNYENRVLTDNEKLRRLNKLVSVYYTFNSFDQIQKTLSAMTDAEIIREYSNMVIAIDEVHNLRLYGKKAGDSIQYTQIHRLLHVVKGCKKIIMSGTPMRDTADEIAPVLNLILPLDKQLPTGKRFIERYLFFDREDGITYIKPDMKEELKEIMKGRVSYLKSMSSVKVDYVGKPMGTLKFMNVIPSYMSEFQSEIYVKAYRKDKSSSEGDDDEDEDEAEEASAPGVFSNSRQATLFVYPDGSYGKEGFKKYIIKKTETLAFVKKGAKIKVFSPSRELEKLKGSTDEETLQNIGKCSHVYATVIRTILDNPDKLHFVYGTLVSGSGNILFGCLLNLVGYRRGKGSENTKDKRYFILSKETSSDESTRKIVEFFSSRKNMTGDYANVLIGSKILSEGITLKNVTSIHVITPHWNYSEIAQAIARGIRLNVHNDLIQAGIKPKIKVYHHVGIPKEGVSIDLDRYELSEKKDISMKNVERLIKEASFDCALTYDRNISKGEFTRECDYQNCDYRCDGIISLKPVGKSSRDYSTYNLYYSAKNVTDIISKIIDFFRQRFSCELDELFLQFKLETPFSIFSALNKIIYENIEIKNCYGFPSYLRESNNIYFLVESLASGSVYTPNSYAKNLIVLEEMSYEGAFNNMCIDMSCEHPENIERYVDMMSEDIKHEYIRHAIYSRAMNSENRAVLNTLKKYNVDGMSYSIGKIKYTLNAKDEWIETELEEEPQPIIEIENPYGYSGSYNDEYFCIKKHVDEAEIADTRATTTGRSCPKSWHIDELADIAIELGVPYEDKSSKFKGIKSMEIDEIIEKLSTTKARDFMDRYVDLPIDKLRCALYFFSSRKDVSCSAIRKWLESQGLLEYNETCGKSGAKKLKLK